MKETLRILFSAAFLSAVFLVAYNYVNSPSGDGPGFLSYFFGPSNPGNQGEEESAPAEDGFQFGVPASMETPASMEVPPPQPPFQSTPSDPFAVAAEETPIPLSVPESQQAMPSVPYGNLAPPVTDNTLPPLDNLPVTEPLSPDTPDSTVAPIAPDAYNVGNGAPSVPQDIPTSVAPPQSASNDRAEVAAFIEEARQRIANGEIYSTLIRLSQFYNAPEFLPEETRQIHFMLIQLAGEVIYLHPEKYFNMYTVQPGDTITSIASQHQIPWQFIAKINGMTAPYHVNPGEQIKVVPGPFNAEIHLDRYELTLWLPIGNDPEKSLYAGTFHIGLGKDCPKLQGDYIVDEKFINPEYPKLSNKPTTFGPGDSNNPYGKRLLSLRCVNDPNHVKIGIHGTNNEQYVCQSVPFGYICLGPRDIDDLYDILSIGSRVKIER